MVNEPLFSGKVRKKADARNVAVTLNTNIFNENLVPGYTPLAFFAIYAVFEDSGVLMVRRTFTDLPNTPTKTEVLNEGNNLAANAAYIFAVPISDNEEFNIWFSTNTIATKVTIIESQIE